MNLKNKSLLLLLFIMLSFSVATFIILKISFTQTKSLLNESIASQIIYSAERIEQELKKVEDLSFAIISDPDLQSSLSNINNETILYKKQQEINKLYENLYAKLPVAYYITAIHIFDSNGHEYVGGFDSKIFNESVREKVFQNARIMDGAHVWIPVSSSTPVLISARSILNVAGLKLNELGFVFIIVDMDKLVRHSLKVLTKYNIDLAIVQPGETIFLTDEKLNPERIIDYNATQGYSIETLNNEKYFLSYIHSKFLDWLYICILSYEEVFRSRRTLMNATILFLAIAILFVTFIVGRRITKNLTQPIIALASVMKGIEENEFLIDSTLLEKGNEMDEIGILYKEFNIMTQKLHTLINENLRKQIVIKDTQFRSLQSQINPHFLYNTLESINWIATLNKQNKIAVMIKSLGKLLRTSISKQEAIITIEEELALMNHYLTIQKIRYEDRLEVNFSINDEIKPYAIPKLVLQPLVENSIKYGLEKLTGVCQIKICGKKENDIIRITVEDNGNGMSSDLIKELMNREAESNTHGLGLKNINERLVLVFGEQCGLFFESGKSNGSSVSIVIKALLRYELDDIWTREIG